MACLSHLGSISDRDERENCACRVDFQLEVPLRIRTEWGRRNFDPRFGIAEERYVEMSRNDECGRVAGEYRLGGLSTPRDLQCLNSRVDSPTTLAVRLECCRKRIVSEGDIQSIRDGAVAASGRIETADSDPMMCLNPWIGACGAALMERIGGEVVVSRDECHRRVEGRTGFLEAILRGLASSVIHIAEDVDRLGG
jgi:hypothetical protein